MDTTSLRWVVAMSRFTPPLGSTEAQEQEAVVEFCTWRRIPVFHIPNGGYRNPREAAKLKAQGVKPGVPDLCIPVARGGYHGLYIEMKVGKNKPTEHQEKWLKLLNEQGYKAIVCYGALNAICAIKRYVAL